MRGPSSAAPHAPVKPGESLGSLAKPHGFSRAQRVRRRGDFVRIQGGGARVTTRHFVLLVAAQPPGSEGALPRLGLVASRKVGVAVIRNRIKRICRACFRQWPGLLPAGVDLVVIAKSGAERLGTAGVQAEWRGVARLLARRADEALARRGVMPHGSAGTRV